MTKTKIIAFYLPQFHPIPENDKWWGKGFTEWTNVGKAKPLFKGHYQPRVPADLGYYDLRIPEVREVQAELAREAGIEGFCYWHYWFGNGKRLLERPFNEVLESGKPDFQFCLGWANHSWKRKTWTDTKRDEMLIEQTYGGEEDYIDHFNAMLPSFKDKRYMKRDDKLIFLIWDTSDIPDFSVFKDLWNKLAIENNLCGFFFIGFTFKCSEEEEIYKKGFDSVCIDAIMNASEQKKYVNKVVRKIRNMFNLKTPKKIPYDTYTDYFIKTYRNSNPKTIPCLIPNFDHTPRSGGEGIVLLNSTPLKFGQFLKNVIQILKSKNKSENIIFIKSWNEWGEGNYVEPDLKYGKAYLDAMGKVLK
jgi:hypothetical protein